MQKAQTRCFVIQDEKSSKFWEITQTNGSVIVRYGKTGTAGQNQAKEFADEAAASKHVQKLIAEKLGKGYIEVSQVSGPDTETDETSERRISASGKSKVARDSSNSVNVDGLSTSEMVELASNPNSTSKQLAALVNKHFEVNRAIAKQQNATAKTLRLIADQLADELEDCDVETQRLIAQNPNTPVDLLVKLGHRFTPDLLSNPALSALMIKKPKFLDQFPGVARLPQCPESYLRSISDSENDVSKLDMLRNPNLPQDICKKLTPEYFDRRSMDSLKAFAAEQNDAEDRNYVDAYAKNSQSYCIPRFVPLDRSNPTHRLDDQVVRGFPFTSANWQWAMAKDGTPMQPLAQINLDRAGNLLGMDLGSGLLQIWVKEHREQLLRIVPVSALSETMDAYYPHDAAWNVESDDGEYVTLFYLYLSQMSHPRIEWVRAGQMFPRPYMSMHDWCDEHTKFGEHEREQLSERIESLAIPMMERGDDATKWVHLGGYPGGYGNESDPCTWSGKGERLVLYIQDGNNVEVVFTLQITVSHSSEGKPTFKAYITCDR